MAKKPTEPVSVSIPRKPEEAKTAPSGLHVVTGKSVICRVGIADCEFRRPLRVEDFEGGQATVDKLITSGHLERT